jgi:threonine synthase
MGRIDEARRTLARTKYADLYRDNERAAFLATRGLIEYRSGEAAKGRASYSAAVETTKEPSIRALAAIMFAREELDAKTPFGLEIAHTAFRLQAEPGSVTFEIVRDLVDDVVTVDEQAILEAMRFLAAEHGLAVERAGAVAVAAIRTGAAEPRGRTVAIVSGRNA